MFDPGFRKPFPDNVPANVGGGWWRPTPLGPHNALDIPTPTGTPIVAVGDGVVIRSQKTPTPEAGIWVGIRHPSGLSTRYLHLSQALVDVGQHVVQGQQIGVSGSTGLSETPHLHLDMTAPATLLPMIEQAAGKPRTGWGASFNDWGVFIPPEPWIPVDSYRMSTALRDIANGVKTWKDLHGRSALVTPSATLLIGASVVATSAILGAALLRRRRHAFAV